MTTLLHRDPGRGRLRERQQLAHLEYMRRRRPPHHLAENYVGAAPVYDPAGQVAAEPLPAAQ